MFFFFREEFERKLNLTLIISWVQKYWSNNIHPFISKDVWNYVKHKLGIRISETLMIWILKENLLMLYIKRKSRVLCLQHDKQDMFKLLFAIHTIQLLPEFNLLLKVDEFFSRSTKLTHFLMKRWKSFELINICLSSSASLITIITSNGKVFKGNTKGAVNSTMFLSFSKKLWSFIEEDCNVKTNICLVILDNTSTHRWKKIIEYWK